MPESVLQKQLKKEQPFDSLELETFLNLLRTHNMIAAAPGRLMKRHGLSSAQFNILRILAAHRGPGLPCLEIVQQMVTRVPDITRLVDRLAEAQLVERTRSVSDRRVVMISITEKGRQLTEEIRRPLLEIHRQNLEHMSEEELTQLNQLLVKARIQAEADLLPEAPE